MTKCYLGNHPIKGTKTYYTSYKGKADKLNPWVRAYICCSCQKKRYEKNTS